MSPFLDLHASSQPVPLRQDAARVFGLYKALLSLLVILLGNLSASAQLNLWPVQPVSEPGASHSPARRAALVLPFFDDFSTATAQPDPALWSSGGVYVNNTLGLNAPSRNVVTFDGLDRTGRPYGLGNAMGVQSTDTLTSQAIDLSGLSPSDSVYLSYYWQRQGLGELPDDEDSLRLQFLNSQGNWATVWKSPASSSTSAFTQTLIPVRDRAYLHGAFRFRFQTFGRASGSFDNWNLDYVYLNRNRNAGDRYIRDIAVRTPVSPYLKRYTAMPLRQYLVNPAAETADSVRTDLVNLFNNFNFTTLRFRVREEISGQVIQTYEDPSAQPIASLASQGKRVRPTPLPATFAGQRALIRSTFDILTTDDQNPSLPTVNLRRNDTISSLTVLDDYYAYDDGSAEMAINSGRTYTRFMLRFVTNRPDAVTGLRINLVPYLQDASNQAFSIAVMSSQQGRPGTVLHQQSAQVRYGTSRNGFVEFPFNRPDGVAVTDTFFVGWTQVTEAAQGFAVGFDKNGTAYAPNFYVNLGSGWNLGSDVSSDVRGIPMIRPVMGGRATTVVTGTQNEPLAPLRVYPNPTRGPIRWDHSDLRQIDVFDAAGKLLRTIAPVNGQQETDLSNLSPGLYYLRLQNDRQAVTQKVLLAR
ncbi:T9SS type A sorting domain-containing protein [Tellurirhabdus rosea]|uniref:T9SS type A sorting domain-containing protein n=1 Tax=Tellurirhabdus rosea TaxID=2674997 RepID=UPI002251AA00|nr:T9SS type A sorting domain-containing protein [Tellurirhabdus rosea]